VTLLELVVTLTILSLIAAIGLQAFRLGSRSWQRGEERAEAEQRVRIVYSTMAQTLASLVPTTAEVDGKRVVAFRGRQEWILFHAAPAGHGPLPFSAMIRGVAFSVEPGTGLVMQESYPLAEGEASLEPRGPIQVLDPHVTQVRFRYLAPPLPDGGEPQWVEAWDPRDAAQETAVPVSPFPGGLAGTGAASAASAALDLPLAVEMTLVMREARDEREFRLVVPLHLGRSL
jgi:hypothetical protein